MQPYDIAHAIGGGGLKTQFPGRGLPDQGLGGGRDR